MRAIFIGLLERSFRNTAENSRAWYENLLDLPGIGRYTAGAILSIAFGKPYPVVDGNVMRVLARSFAVKKDLRDPATQRQMWKLAGRSRGYPVSPGDWNQGLMELGATVCVPRNPLCPSCPVRRFCRAFACGIQNRLPVKKRERYSVEVIWTCLWIEKNGSVLLWKRRKGERLLKNLWGLPESGRLDVRPGKLLKRLAPRDHSAPARHQRFARLPFRGFCPRKRARCAEKRKTPGLPGFLPLA